MWGSSSLVLHKKAVPGVVLLSYLFLTTAPVRLQLPHFHCTAVRWGWHSPGHASPLSPSWSLWWLRAALRSSQVCLFFLSARMLEKARQQLQEEILCVQSQLLDEKKKREHQEALVRRLQKRVVLLTKVSFLEKHISLFLFARCSPSYPFFVHFCKWCSKAVLGSVHNGSHGRHEPCL